MVYVFGHNRTVNILTDIRAFLVPVEGHNNNGRVVSEQDGASFQWPLLVSLVDLTGKRESRAPDLKMSDIHDGSTICR